MMDNNTVISSADIRSLYQELIIDHGTQPRNCCSMSCADCKGEGYNPLCGDQISLFIKFKFDEANPSFEKSEENQMSAIIGQVTFQGKGCAISTASASLLTEAVLDKTIHQAIEFSKAFLDSVTIKSDENAPNLGKLTALAGVIDFPARIKCATLAWHALLSALKSHCEAKQLNTEKDIYADI